LAGRAESVNEQRIAEEVFRRSSTFNPGEDNIVRVTVSHLRARLEEYYEGDGRADPWRFEIPKGKYSPQLWARSPEPQEKAQAASEPATREMSEPRRWTQQIWLRLVVPILITNAITAYVLPRVVPSSGSHYTGALAGLLGPADLPVTIVGTDESLWAYRNIFLQVVPLSDYIGRNYAQPSGNSTSPIEDRALAYAKSRQGTSGASAAAVSKLQTLLSPQRVEVRLPFEVSMPDFERNNVVLLGGPWVNPWVQLFDSKLNFQTVTAPGAVVSEIHNAHPQPGEPVDFIAHIADGAEVSYVRVALVPNLNGTGRVLLIGGNRGASQEAGCNFLARPSAVKNLLKRFGKSNVSELDSFELLLEVTGISRTPVNVKIVGQRPRA
jgi:hypothetical protein